MIIFDRSWRVILAGDPDRLPRACLLFSPVHLGSLESPRKAMAFPGKLDQKLLLVAVSAFFTLRCCLENVHYYTVFPSGRTRILPQGYTIISLVCFSLVVHTLPSLITNGLNLPIGTQRRSWRLNEDYFL